MKTKIQIILLLFLFIGCVKNEFSSEDKYIKNSSDLLNSILFSKDNHCNCIVDPMIIQKQQSLNLLDLLKAETTKFDKNKLKKALEISNDSIFNICNELSKHFTLSNDLKKKFIILNIDEIKLMKKDSSIAKKILKKCPNFWINIGPAVFNENYTKAIIPFGQGVGGSLRLYQKINNEWKFVKPIMFYIS